MDFNNLLKGSTNIGQSAVDTADSGEAGESRDHDIRGNGQIKSTQMFFEDLRQGMLIKGAVEVTREKISQFAIVTDDINVAHQSIAHGMLLASLAVGVVSNYLGSSRHNAPLYLNLEIDFQGMMRANRTMFVEATVTQFVEEYGKHWKVLFNFVGRNSQTGKTVISGRSRVLVPKRNR